MKTTWQLHPYFLASPCQCRRGTKLAANLLSCCSTDGTCVHELDSTLAPGLMEDDIKGALVLNRLIGNYGNEIQTSTVCQFQEFGLEMLACLQPGRPSAEDAILTSVACLLALTGTRAKPILVRPGGGPAASPSGCCSPSGCSMRSGMSKLRAHSRSVHFAS